MYEKALAVGNTVFVEDWYRNRDSWERQWNNVGFNCQKGHDGKEVNFKSERPPQECVYFMEQVLWSDSRAV